MTTAFGTGEKPVFSAESNRADGIFRGIIVNVDSGIMEELFQSLPMIQCVVDRFSRR